MSEPHDMVTAEHLQRTAFLYVRQSTFHQVMHNTESGRRQYDLRGRAIALGWTAEQIVVVDDDQGRSAASSAGREGFQKLVAEVGVGRAGIVMGLEVSRLARNNADWHRLIEICALADTLILDEEGLYDPSRFNDRLLLGLKGTMSEAELHVLRSRLRGGILSKARRAELRVRLPVGFVYDVRNQVVLDPDKQVQESIRMLLSTFERAGSAHQAVRQLRDQALLFPRRLHTGPCKGELVWGPLIYQRALQLLRNPRYAGAFAFGKTRTRRGPDGLAHLKHQPSDKWIALVPQAHEGYLTWDNYQRNLQRLQANARAHDSEHRTCPPREGPALLQGLVLCGRCGSAMTVRYHVLRGRVSPEYVCVRTIGQQIAPSCQSIPGAALDDAVGQLLIELMTPVAIEVSLLVQQEMQAQLEQADQLRHRNVERAQYEVDLARQRFMRVHPDNRMVADSLEADWNDKLRAAAEAQRDYERERQRDTRVFDEQHRTRILGLAQDFPRLWADPGTPQRDRKRMVRLLIQDVTLVKGEQVTAHIRFNGGATKTLSVPRALPAWQRYKTPADVVEQIDRLLDAHTDGEIARILNEQGLRSVWGKPFDAQRIKTTRRSHRLESRRTRLRKAGLLTARELGRLLGISGSEVRARRAEGTLGIRAYRVDDTGEHAYEAPSRSASEAP
jgi:DNA invertase Pin-like site-specific DNA recombinase